ncbi:MAG: hypothetical protein WCE21_01720 [Candidatus Babeliales bacterium]
MNIRLSLFTCLVIVQCTHAVITEPSDTNNTSNISLAICRIGLQKVKESIVPSDGNFLKEINQKKLSAGIADLLKAIEGDCASNSAHVITVNQSIIDFFKNNELAQFLILHGYADPVLNTLNCTVSDLGVPLCDTTYTVHPGSAPFVTHFAPPWPTLTPDNTSTVVKTKEIKTTYYLSQLLDVVNCVTEYVQPNALLNSSTQAYPLNKGKFHSFIIGNKNCIYTYELTDKDEYVIDIVPTQFPEHAVEPWNSLTKDKSLYLQLSPDEKKLFFLTSRYDSHYDEYKISNAVFDIENKKIIHRIGLSNKWYPSFDNIRWNYTGTALHWSGYESSYHWPIESVSQDTATLLKLSLHAHWLKKLEQTNFKNSPALQDIYTLRRFMGCPIPKNIPVSLQSSLADEKKHFTDSKNLQKLLP